MTSPYSVRECFMCGGPLTSSLVCLECASTGGSKDTMHMQPHPGPQEAFLRTTARFNINGGARGGGKTRGSAMRPMSFRPRLDGKGFIIPVFEDPRFRGIIFRREAERLRKTGGMWDELKDIYMPFGAKSNNNEMSLTFPNGAKVQCAGIEHEKDVEKYRGLAFTWILVEEGTEFTQFIIDALRRCSRPVTRGLTAPWIDVTCNPDPDSWLIEYVRKFLDDEGYPDPQKCARTYYAVPISKDETDGVMWVDELFENDPEVAAQFDNDPSKYRQMSEDIEIPALSVTFTPSTVDDNPTITEEDPSYVAELENQEAHLADRERRGGWYATQEGGTFSKARFHFVQPYNVPAVVYQRMLRYWDLAGTKKQRGKSTPDSSAGVLTASLMCPECDGWRFDEQGIPCELCNTARVDDHGDRIPIVPAHEMPLEEDELEPTFWIVDAVIETEEPDAMQHHVRKTAERDGLHVPVYIEEEKVGTAGKYAVEFFNSTILPEYDVYGDRPGTGKEGRAGMWSGPASRGLVFVVVGPWVGTLRAATRVFPKKGKNGERDLIDGISGGYLAHLTHDWKRTDDHWGAAVSPR